MMPKVLWETTLNPKTRRLLRVEIADQLVTDRVINELMGKDASARFRFIMDRAEEVAGAGRLTTSERAGSFGIVRDRWGSFGIVRDRWRSFDVGDEHGAFVRLRELTIKSYRDLECWQLGVQLRNATWHLLRGETWRGISSSAIS